MKALSLTMVIAALGVSGQAQAQTVTPTQQFSVTGVAASGCLMQAPSSPSSNNASVASASPGAADIVIGQLVGDDGVSVGATVILTLPAACNQAHRLTLGSANGGLINADGIVATAPFRATLPYAVAIDWGVNSQTFNSTDQAVTFSNNDAAAGSVTVTIEIPAGGAPLVAGGYTDTLVLELAAAG